MSILTNILIVALVIAVYVIYNLLHKNEKQEDIIVSQNLYMEGQNLYIDKISTIVETSHNKLEELDTLGAFKSDDEVGLFFAALKEVQKLLDNFNLNRLQHGSTT